MKSKAKNRDKKKERKHLNAAATSRQKDVDAILLMAKQEVNPFDYFRPFQVYDRNGLDLHLMHHTSDTLPSTALVWCIDLCERNMKLLYEPVWGWNAGKKRRQLIHPESQFIVACRNDESNAPVAYANYRYEEEEWCPVMYVYELQVEDSVQRMGLGKFLMQLLELIARRQKLEGIMLTVLHANTAAAELYRKLGYVVDESSPSVACPWEDCAYEILRKPLLARSSQKETA